MNAQYIANFDQYLDDYKTIIPNLSWTSHGILTSEGFALCCMAKIYNIDLMIESGVRNGRSTQIWAEFLKNISIKGVDVKIYKEATSRLSKYDNVELICGDGCEKMVSLVESNESKKIGVFIDGPKGKQAIEIARKLINYDNVLFVGIHDLHKLRLSGKEYECRQELEQFQEFIFCTDDQIFLNKYSFLDEQESINIDTKRDIRWTPYKYVDKSGKVLRELGSYGPTIGFIGKNIMARGTQ